MDGGDSYGLCITSYEQEWDIPVATLCSTGQYYNGNSCATFDDQTVQPQFLKVALIGRPPTADAHWSTTNVPLEASPIDPLPGSCGDVSKLCNQTYTGQKRYS